MYQIRIILILITGIIFGCSKKETIPNIIPSTFVVSLNVEPPQRQTKDLYLALINLSKKYGLEPRGDGASGGKQWQIQFFFGENYAGGGITTNGMGTIGDVILFNLQIYAFQNPLDYESFKLELLNEIKIYGRISGEKNQKALSKTELLKRGNNMGIDVTTQCSPAILN